jgi:hypothetical protein
MILKNRFQMLARITFDIPLMVGELHRDYEFICQGVIAKASRLMKDHLSINHQALKFAEKE